MTQGIPPRTSGMATSLAGIGASQLQVQQSPTGVAKQQIFCIDNQVSWQNVIRYPQPNNAPINGDLLQGVTLPIRLTPGAFYSAAAEALKVVARIQWGIGNDFNLAVVDVPSNSQLRIPLVTDRVTVDVATVLSSMTAATFAAPGAANPASFPSIFENIPASFFRAAVAGGNSYQTLPLISAGVMGAGGYGPTAAGIPQRQIELYIPAGQNASIPRPSGAANFQYMIITGETVTVSQLVPAGFIAAQGPNVSNKLLTDAYSIYVNNTGGTTALVAVSFDIVI